MKELLKTPSKSLLSLLWIHCTLPTGPAGEWTMPRYSSWRPSTNVETPNTITRLLFVDFTSAATHPCWEVDDPLQFGSPGHYVGYWHSNQPVTKVFVNGSYSNILHTSTCSMQGCVLSPLLYVWLEILSVSLGQDLINLLLWFCGLLWTY